MPGANIRKFASVDPTLIYTKRCTVIELFTVRRAQPDDGRSPAELLPPLKTSVTSGSWTLWNRKGLFQWSKMQVARVMLRLKLTSLSHSENVHTCKLSSKMAITWSCRVLFPWHVCEAIRWNEITGTVWHYAVRYEHGEVAMDDMWKLFYIMSEIKRKGCYSSLITIVSQIYWLEANTIIFKS